MRTASPLVSAHFLCYTFRIIYFSFDWVIDFLAMVAGVGFIVSSALTLLVFFPRSIAQENGYTLLAQPSVTSQAPGQYRSGDDDDYRNFDYNDAMPTPVAMGQMSSMPSPEEDREHRRKAQEWISQQQQNQGEISPGANGASRGFAFGSRARGGSMSSANGGVARAGPNSPAGAAARPISGVSGYSTNDEGDKDKVDEDERDANRDTMISLYSATDTTTSPTPTSHNVQLPPSYTPASPATPGTPGQRRPFATAPSLPTVIEPDNSRTTTPLPNMYSTLTPIPASASPLNNIAPSSRPSRPVYFKADSDIAPGAEPLDYDFVDLESASVRAGANGTLHPSDSHRSGKDHLSRSSSTSKAALIPSASRTPGAGIAANGGGEGGASGTARAGGRNELADVPFEEMRARGSRYSELAVRRAAARGEQIHPLVRILYMFDTLSLCPCSSFLLFLLRVGRLLTGTIFYFPFSSNLSKVLWTCMIMAGVDEKYMNAVLTRFHRYP